jgi:hypothetical protein
MSAAIQTRIGWGATVLFTAAYTQANLGCTSLDWGICFAGFPTRRLVSSDAGGLQAFTWPVPALNAFIGLFSILLIIGLLWGIGHGRRWVQYSLSALFTAAYAWANPFFPILRPSEFQPRPGFTDFSIAEAGFPLTLRTTLDPNVNWALLLLNIIIGLVCVEFVYRICEKAGGESPRLGSVVRFLAIVGPVYLYASFIQFSAFLPSRLWRNVDFAHTVVDSGLTYQLTDRWFVPGTDLAVGVLLAALLIYITARVTPIVVLFVTAYIWANLKSWPAWYEWLGVPTEFASGFPFPIHRRFAVDDLVQLIIANVLIGAVLGYFVYRSCSIHRRRVLYSD